LLKVETLSGDELEKALPKTVKVATGKK